MKPEKIYTHNNSVVLASVINETLSGGLVYLKKLTFIFFYIRTYITC